MDKHFNSWSFCYAVSYGNLENIKWLKSIGCTFDSLTYDYVVFNGNLTIINWLNEHNYSYYLR